MAEFGISFGTDGWRAQGAEFTLDRVRAIGTGVGRYLDAHSVSGSVAIGYDSRDGSHEAAYALAAALVACGRTPVVSTRDCPTPALAWVVADGPFAGGLMVTASHNPPDYNGVKFLMADGSPALPAVTDELETLLSNPETASERLSDIEQRAFHDPYLDAVCSTIAADLTGVRVIYDAMHGSGRGVTDEALSRAGATVDRLRCTRDPAFGGTAPEPTPENATALREHVEDGDADIGIINDGDADRVGVVTPERGYLDANVLLAVLYEFLLETRSGDVVRTVPTSSLVDRVAESAGYRVHETPVGFKWVAAAMTEHDALFGGEESGGYGLTEHVPNKDGVLTAVLACAAESERSLDARLDALFETHGEIHQKQVSITCREAEKTARVAALANAPPSTVAGSEISHVSTVDGVKLTLASGEWVLVRPSGTEPKIRIYAEASSESRLSELLDSARAFV